MKKIKTFISIFLALVLCVSSVVSVNAYTPLSKVKVGDINSDGSVNISDATDLQNYLINSTLLTDDGMATADYNGDSIINISDVTEIQKMLAGLDYECFITPDYDYITLNYRNFCDNIEDEYKIDFEILYNQRDLVFNNRANNESSKLILITSKEQYYAVFGIYSTNFDDEFFAENALLVYLVACSGYNVSIDVLSVGVKDGKFLATTVCDYPWIQSPMPTYLHLFCKISKSDLSSIL